MMLWTVDESAPVIVPGGLHPEADARRAGAAHVVLLEGKLRMYYWGSDGDGLNSILMAEAPVEAPNAWEPVGRALIGAQPESDYNCSGPGFPFVLRVTERRWLLYFTGWGRRADGRLPNTTGVAVSDDAGESWRYHPMHPIIPLDRGYDAEGTGSLWILREGGRFRMYYTAIGSYGPKPEGVATGHGDTIPRIGIGYAESRDGIHWEKPLDELVVAPRGFGVEPYEYICSKPCVMRIGSGYVMWVNTFGTAYRVHRLTSEDGLRWEWAERQGPDGEFGVGEAGAFDDHQRSYPTMVELDGTLHAWFTGNGFGGSGMGYARASASECGPQGGVL